MSVPRMLPTFLLETEKSVEQGLDCVRQAVENSPADYMGKFSGHHAMIGISKSKRHFWSPWMNLEVRDTESRREVFVRFSPHPSIWTGFMFCYFAIGVLVFFAAMLGMAQQLIQQTAWGYYFIPAGLLIAFLLWLASRIGQKLADSEMRQMKLTIQGCIGDDDD